jgi:hypothetical protein
MDFLGVSGPPAWRYFSTGALADMKLESMRSLEFNSGSKSPPMAHGGKFSQ